MSAIDRRKFRKKGVLFQQFQMFQKINIYYNFVLIIKSKLFYIFNFDERTKERTIHKFRK